MYQLSYFICVDSCCKMNIVWKLFYFNSLRFKYFSILVMPKVILAMMLVSLIWHSKLADLNALNCQQLWL